MSAEPQDPIEMATRPLKQHEWLQNLLGEWRVESEMAMETGGPIMKLTGTASVKSLGGLWAYSEDTASMPGGVPMQSYFALGYDVTFQEYRGSMIMSASSHLWKYVGTLSEDGKTMTLNCEGPDMVGDAQTALYRDVIELIDENHRVLTSYAQDKQGNWVQFVKADYYRV